MDRALSLVSQEDRDLSVQIYLNKFQNDLRRGESNNGIDDLAEARRVIGVDSLGSSMASYCTNYGIYMLFQSQFLEALNWLLRAKELANLQDFDLIQLTNHNLASIYVEIGAYDKGLQVIQENVRWARKEEVPYRELFSLYTIATAYRLKEEWDSVKTICRQAMELKDRANISTSFGYIYFQLGLAHLAEEEIDSALHAFQAGITLSDEQNERKEAGECHYGMSMAYFQLDDLEKAAFHSTKARERLFYYVDDLNYHHAKIQARQQNFRQAYETMSHGFLEQQATYQAPSSYQIIETLLTNAFEEEKQIVDFQHKRELEKQLMYGAGLLTILVFVTLSTILYFQAKSKRKLTLLNTELQAKNQDLTHFTYITSHDLKEPIRNINSFAGLIDRSLKQKQVDIPRFQEYLGFIMANSNTSYQIIESLRTYINLASDEMEYKRVPVAQVFQEVCDELQGAIEERNGQVRFHNHDGIKEVYFSASMLGLVLRNLIRNGLVHNDTNAPKVEVSLEEKAGKGVFKVSENGKGIDPSFHEQIFQPFATLANKSLTQSSGLGLAICKSILEKTGNRIWLESEKGQGSHFYFSIPKEKS
ncbi:MAG: hypothetical protein HRU41_12865 [Saprospiraceae bacterium]|nr:hypothetical protein [Saprospiraceae bacterium]